MQKKKTGKQVKKGVPRRKPSAGAKAPKKKAAKAKKPFRLEVGNTYENRTGTFQAKITSRLHWGRGSYNEFLGVIVTGKQVWKQCGCFWHASGAYHDPEFVYAPETWRDLVREVKGKKG